MSTCKHCQKKNPPKAMFCVECGRMQKNIDCPRCDQKMSTTFIYCPSCGAKAIHSKKNREDTISNLPVNHDKALKEIVLAFISAQDKLINTQAQSTEKILNVLMDNNEKLIASQASSNKYQENTIDKILLGIENVGILQASELKSLLKLFMENFQLLSSKNHSDMNITDSETTTSHEGVTESRPMPEEVIEETKHSATPVKGSIDEQPSKKSQSTGIDKEVVEDKQATIFKETEGARRQATVLMSDLSGFTAMNEKLDPEDVREIMEELIEKATSIVGLLRANLNSSFQVNHLQNTRFIELSVR